MARVEWTRLSGEEIEAVLGVLLCREHPTATRVKPSRGDGGIDVWVPEGESAAVYQIKGYTGNIDSTRQSHIRTSWTTLLAYAKDKSITLSAWYLVTPENPTKEQLEWFKKLTEGVSFPCVWRGLDFVDGLAAKYPEVIDYYLRDGKDRLEETVQRFLSVAGLKNSAASPATSVDALKELHTALNQFDPHYYYYYYDFSVQMLNADGTCPPVPMMPGTVASARLTDNERCITYNIVPRFKEALKERPVPGRMTLGAEPGSPLRQQLDDWAKFGGPLTDFPATNVELDLPGGFAGEYEEARVTIGASKPLPGSVHETISLRVLEADGSFVGSLDFVTEEASSGIDQKGVRSIGHDKVARTSTRCRPRGTRPARWEGDPAMSRERGPWLPDDALRALAERGWTYDDIAMANEHVTGWHPSKAAVLRKLERIGVPPRKLHHRDVIPWRVRPEHAHDRIYYGLQALSREQQGVRLGHPDQCRARWMHEQLDAGLAPHYTPWDGWCLVKAA